MFPATRVTGTGLLGLMRTSLPRSSAMAMPSASLLTATWRASVPSATPSAVAAPLLLPTPWSSGLMGIRFYSRGDEYQPSCVKRKRKHGFLKRLRSFLGRKTLKNRVLKGRKYLSH